MTRISKPALTLSLLACVLLASTAPAIASSGKANMDGLSIMKHVDISTTVQPRAGSQTIGKNEGARPASRPRQWSGR